MAGSWGDWDGRRATAMVGSATFLGARGVPVADGMPEETTAYVAIDGQVAGAIEFADRLRHQVPG